MKLFAKFTSIALLAVLAAAPLFAEGQKDGKGKMNTVGIAMPTQSSARWIADGGNMKKILEERGWDDAFLPAPAFDEFILRDTTATETVLKEIGLIS